MTGFNNVATWKPLDFGAHDAEILKLWQAGNDTLDIARALMVAESEVARRVPVILERNRQDCEWNFDRLVGASA